MIMASPIKIVVLGDRRNAKTSQSPHSHIRMGKEQEILRGERSATLGIVKKNQSAPAFIFKSDHLPINLPNVPTVNLEEDSSVV